MRLVQCVLELLQGNPPKIFSATFLAQLEAILSPDVIILPMFFIILFMNYGKRNCFLTFNYTQNFQNG